jgi:7-alpha-hydroxysteroid dehydrogenase
MSILDRFRLDGGAALITGGGAGIGAGIARGFAEAGADVAIVARSAGALAAVKAEIEALGRRCVAIPMDVTEPGAPARITRAAHEGLGKLTILVNNVGGLGGGETIHGTMDIPAEVFRKQLDINLTSVLLMTQAAAPLMAEGGAIINMSSIMAYKPFGGSAGYIASKAAMNNLTVALAHDLAPAIRVNGIAPGPILTEALTGPLNLKTEQDYSRIAKEWGVWVQRLGTTDDIANMALLLASGAGGFITGQTFIVAGGM